MLLNVKPSDTHLPIQASCAYFHVLNLRLFQGAEIPVMTPNSVDFSLLFFLHVFILLVQYQKSAWC